MPTAKLGQSSSNEINDLQQKHFDANMRVREMLDVVSLDVKVALISRLPGVIDGIKSDLLKSEANV